MRLHACVGAEMLEWVRLEMNDTAGIEEQPNHTGLYKSNFMLDSIAYDLSLVKLHEEKMASCELALNWMLVRDATTAAV